MTKHTAKRLAWVFAGCLVLALAIAIGIGRQPAGVSAATSDAPLVKEVVVATGAEPGSLSPFTENTLVAQEIRDALMDGPFTHLDFSTQATILTGVPRLLETTRPSCRRWRPQATGSSMLTAT